MRPPSIWRVGRVPVLRDATTELAGRVGVEHRDRRAVGETVAVPRDAAASRCSRRPGRSMPKYESYEWFSCM